MPIARRIEAKADGTRVDPSHMEVPQVPQHACADGDVELSDVPWRRRGRAHAGCETGKQLRMVVHRIQTLIGCVAQQIQCVTRVVSGLACRIHPQRRIVWPIQLLQLTALGARHRAERGVSAINQRPDEPSEIN